VPAIGHALEGSTGQPLSLSVVSRRLVMQSICQLDFRWIPARMLSDAASVPQIMREQLKREATTQPGCANADQSASTKRASPASASRKRPLRAPHFHFWDDSAILFRHMHPFTIVFDLDGTLVDTAPDLMATLNVVLAREGLQPIAYADGRLMVGGGARAMVERGIKAKGHLLPATEIDRLVRDFIIHYAEHIADHSRPYDGVEAVLDQLAESGCRLAVCTNKLEWLSLRLLDALGLRPRFRAICGADTFGVSKPDPVILNRTIERAGGNKTRAVMIGDSFTDIATARAASIPVIAVDFGYTDVPVAELKPDRVVSAFSELPDAISRVLSTG
jgi:phosphoglycolate phosphatase